MKSTRKLMVLSFLLAAGIVLYIVEALYLPSLPVPGAKLGLTSITTLIVLVLYSWRECLLHVVARTVIGSVLAGTFLTPVFLFSFTGALMSALVMILVYEKLYGKFSLAGVSLTGATTHNMAQLILAAFFVGHPGVFFQMPFLILIAIPTGVFNGVAAGYLVQRTAALSI